jgi:DUF4097 and DUF4098 domain-containing protein YvlB
MKRQIQGAAFAAAPFLIGSAAHAQWSSAYTAPRNAVVDASGARSVEVEAGAGSLRVEGKPGDLKVFNVGSLEAADGSGDVNVRNVTGSFTVETDGSGSIYATDVRGSVIVQNDGSGGIEVNKVGRDFKVESKGSGSIEYTAVSGQVDIPERHRDRYRRGQER